MSNSDLRHFLKTNGIKQSELAAEMGFLERRFVDAAQVHRWTKTSANLMQKTQNLILRALSRKLDRQVTYEEVWGVQHPESDRGVEDVRMP